MQTYYLNRGKEHLRRKVVNVANRTGSINKFSPLLKLNRIVPWECTVFGQYTVVRVGEQ